jgi:hypothetical protein
MNLQLIAVQAEQIVKEYQAGNISADEYKELIKDMGFVTAVYSETAQLEENIFYRNAILTAINIAAAIA